MKTTRNLTLAATVAASAFALSGAIAADNSSGSTQSGAQGVPGVEMNVGKNASDRGLPGVEMNVGRDGDQNNVDIGRNGDQKNLDTRTMGAGRDTGTTGTNRPMRVDRG